VQRKKSFVVVLLALVFGLAANAQVTSASGKWVPNKRSPLLADPAVTSARTLAAQVFPAPYGLPAPANPTSAWFTTHYASVLPRDFYARNLGFACQKEWKFEKATGIPLRIRLGSLEQCNRLEGK